MKGKEGHIVTVIGEEMLTLLEVLGSAGSEFLNGERLSINKDKRTKISSVLGRIPYDRLTDAAKSNIRGVISVIVENNERRFVAYLNNAGPISSRVHALELIPGIGKTYMNSMIDERERKKFASYEDLQERVGLSNPVEHITDRILYEISGQSRRVYMFVKR